MIESEHESAALIADCKDDIANLTEILKGCSDPDNYAWIKSQLKRQQIALESLEAVSRTVFTCNGCGHEMFDEHPSSCDCGGDGYSESLVYNAPPVPVMQPVELPVIQVDNPLDGFFYRCDEVIAAIRAAGGSVKDAEQ